MAEETRPRKEGPIAAPVELLLIDGSPRGGGRTATVLEAIAAGARQAGASALAIGLGGDLEGATGVVLERAPRCEAFVFGSPTYRATYTAELKHLLDRMPRGMEGEPAAPLRARAAAIALTGATFHHFLAVDSLRNVLAGFFGCFVLPGGLYVPHEAFDADGRLQRGYAELAHRLGHAVVALAEAIRAAPALGALAPQL